MRIVLTVASIALGIAACGDGDDTGPSNVAPTAAFAAQCDHLACTFSNGSTDADGTIEVYAWDFGDEGQTSTDTSPQHAYRSPGDYIVGLTVTDNLGDTGHVSKQITTVARQDFPPVPSSALTYVRVFPETGVRASRYVLYEDSTFALQYVVTGFGFFEYTGIYSRVNAQVAFYFDANSGQWQATATVQGDSLIVDYNAMMGLDDFEDGVYRLAEGLAGT
jgi:PKD repeat protein